MLGGALGEHLDGSVAAIANEARKLMAVRHPVGGKTKAYALNVTGEDYMLGNHFGIEH